MKRFMFARDTFGVSKNSAIFRVAMYGVCFVVILCCGCSNNGIGTVVGEGKVPSAPSAPSGVSVTAASSSSATLSWQSVSQADGYNVYRSTGINDSYSKVGRTTSDTLYTNTGLSSGTIYYYKASAYNSGGESPLSSYTLVTTIPAVPSGGSAKPASSGIGNVTVSWPPVGGAIGYKVFRGTSIDDRQYESVYTTSDTSYTDIGLSSGTIYYYKILAFNSSGESSLSSPISTMTPPSRPSNVSAAADSLGDITVSWFSVDNVTRYIVYRGASASGAYDSIYTTSDTLYTNTGLLFGVTYYYKISAYNSGGESPQSTYASAMTVPAAPSDVSATATPSDSITLRWSSVRSATGYIVYRSVSANGTYDPIDTTLSILYIDTGLLSGSTYYYKISAYNGSGKGPLSTSDSATTIPSVPLNVLATATSSGNIIVTWSSVHGAASYKIYRGRSADGLYDSIYTTSSTSYTDIGLSLGATYYYKVSAVNSGGESSLSQYDYATLFLESVTGIFTDYRDGKTYNTVRIGDNKTWMAENLNYEIVNSSWCYDNEEFMCDTYGKLYNWTAASNSACPSGWHLPSRMDWAELASIVGGTGIFGNGGTAGTKLKSSSDWRSSGVPDGTDDYEFSAKPSGYRNSTGGGFSDIGITGYWWTSSEDDNGNAYYRSMKSNSEEVSQDVNDKRVGMSVRCVQE